MISKNRRKVYVFLAVAALLTACALFIASYFNLLPSKVYSAEDFGIEAVKSTVDFDNDGIDDFTDIMPGARSDAENHPKLTVLTMRADTLPIISLSAPMSY